MLYYAFKCVISILWNIYYEGNGNSGTQKFPARYIFTLYSNSHGF